MEEIITTKNLVIHVKKEECEDLRALAKEKGIMMKIGDFKEYPTLFPTNIVIRYDEETNRYVATLATSLYKLYAKNYLEIEFKDINKYYQF